jgi:hypothetical protein
VPIHPVEGVAPRPVECGVAGADHIYLPAALAETSGLTVDGAGESPEQQRRDTVVRMRFGYISRRGMLKVITVGVFASMSAGLMGATQSRAGAARSRHHTPFLLPWTTGRGSRTLGTVVVDGFIGFGLACHGPGRVTLQLPGAYGTASMPCARSGAREEFGVYPFLRAPRHVVVRITAAPTAHWIVEVDQENRPSSGTIPVGPLNRFIHRYKAARPSA